MDFKELCSEIDESRKFVDVSLEKRGSKRLTLLQGLPKEHLKRVEMKICLQWFF